MVLAQLSVYIKSLFAKKPIRFLEPYWFAKKLKAAL